MSRQFEISIDDARFHAFHGVMEQENVVGNEFIVNLSVVIPWSEEIYTDSLSASISYADLYEILKRQMNSPRKLIETVATSIADEIEHRWPHILSGKVSICKSAPPITGIDGSAKVVLFF